MKVIGLILIFVTYLDFSTSQNCTCKLRHHQEIYCASDFAISLWIKNMTIHKNNEISYRFVLWLHGRLSVDGSKALALPTGRDLYTPSLENCGVKLDVGKAYRVTGYVDDLGRLVTDKCQIQVLFNDIKVERLRGFLHYAPRCCLCKVIPCDGNNCASNENSCVWDLKNTTQTNLASCMRGWIVQNKKCEWIVPPELNLPFPGTDNF